MSAIFLIGVAQAFFFAFLIFNKPIRSLADKVLAVWLVFIGFHLLLIYKEYEFGFDFMPHLLGVAWAMPLAQGPFFFLYVQTLVRNPQRIKWQDGLHFVPYLLAYVFSIPFFLLSGLEKVQWMQDFYPNALPLYVQFFSILVLFSGMIYALYVLYLIYRHKKNLRTFFHLPIHLNFVGYRI